MTDGGHDDTEHVLWAENLASPSRTVAKRGLNIFGWAAPHRFARFQFQQEGKRRGDTNTHEEEVRCLEHVDGVDIVVVRVRRVVDCTDSKEEAVDLVPLDAELGNAFGVQDGLKDEARHAEQVVLAERVWPEVPS